MELLQSKILLFSGIITIHDVKNRFIRYSNFDSYEYILYEYGYAFNNNDWNSIITARNVNSDALDYNSIYFNDKIWNNISRVCILEIWFIEKYKHLLNMHKVYTINGNKLTDKFIEENSNIVDLDTAICLLKVSSEFIEKHLDKLSVCNIIRYQKLSMWFINKYIDILDLRNVTIYQNLDEEFIEKYKDTIDWTNVSIYQKLSHEFIDRHIDRIRVFYCIREMSSYFLFEKYKDRLSKLELSSLKIMTLK